jgi:hypothetical protein
VGTADSFAPGEWNAICDQCGGKFKASQLLLQWDNARVCEGCYDPRHPQEFVRPVTDPSPVPWTRPDVPNFKEFATSRVIDAWVLDSITMG